jgi:hypothetical protein
MTRIQLGPSEERAVWVCRVGCGDRHDLGLVWLGCEGAQHLDRCRLAELHRADAGDEVPAPDAAAILERAEHLRDRREAARQIFRRGDLARDDAVAREELLGDGRAPFGRRRESGRLRGDERPAPFRGGRGGVPAPKRAGRRQPPSAPLRRPRVGAQRVKRVVGDETAPDEGPERVDRLPRISPADRVVNRREE